MKMFFTRKWWGPGTRCPEKLWMLHPWQRLSQVGWGLGQPELVGGIAAHGRTIIKVPSNPNLWFYNCAFYQWSVPLCMAHEPLDIESTKKRQKEISTANIQKVGNCKPSAQRNTPSASGLPSLSLFLIPFQCLGPSKALKHVENRNTELNGILTCFRSSWAAFLDPILNTEMVLNRVTLALHWVVPSYTGVAGPGRWTDTELIRLPQWVTQSQWWLSPCCTNPICHAMKWSLTGQLNKQETSGMSSREDTRITLIHQNKPVLNALTSCSVCQSKITVPSRFCFGKCFYAESCPFVQVVFCSSCTGTGRCKHANPHQIPDRQWALNKIQGLIKDLTSAIWISSGSKRGWLGPFARLLFWWAWHMFCRKWLCICFLCFL